MQVVRSDDSRGIQEMKEVNGGIAAWAGTRSNASSETVGTELMDIVGDGRNRNSTGQGSAANTGTAGTNKPQEQGKSMQQQVKGGADSDVSMQDVQELDAVGSEVQPVGKAAERKGG